MEQAKALLDDVTYCGDAYEAMAGADAAVIVTEWEWFRRSGYEWSYEQSYDWSRLDRGTRIRP